MSEDVAHYMVVSAALPEDVITRRPRPTKLTVPIEREFCTRLMNGETMTSICKDPRMPGKNMIVKWLHSKPAFREAYYEARRVQAEVVLDEIIDIADDTSKDFVNVTLSDGKTIRRKTDNEAIQRSRVRIDTRKWIASKLIPRLYGDKTVQEHTVTGDLAQLLERAINKDVGLPSKAK